MKSVRRPVLVAQNDVPDLNMSRMSHACRTKWTYLKKRARPGTLVKRDLRKTGRSLCASLRSRNAHGHLTRELLCENLPVKKPGTKWSIS